MKSLLVLLLPVVLGVAQKQFCEVNSRILGGEYAKEGEFPGVVHLSGRAWDSSKGKETGYGCAGSLISDRWVLTAAHCIFPPSPSHFLSVRVRPAKTHPYFIESREVLPFSKDPFYVEDIGLIWDCSDVLRETDGMPCSVNNDFIPVILWVTSSVPLPQPMSSIHPNFKPVSLPLQGQELTSNEVTLVGWGKTSTTDDESPLKLMKLEHVQLNQTLCRLIDRSENDVLCRYPTESTGATCHGDSGGPIFMDGVQVGVVSGKAPLHIFRKRPLISEHTRVSAYRDWIDEMTGLNNMS